MLDSLKDHPFPIVAHFDSSIVLTFALPKSRLEPLIPECVTLDTFDDKWAFVAVAMVQTKGLRPKGIPQLFGSDFFLAGYRIFVRYTTTEGKRLRGLYILGSETDKRRMEALGNLFTHYKYRKTDVAQQSSGDVITIQSQDSGLLVELETTDDAALPKYSPFNDWKEARRFAGPLPFTISYDRVKKKVLIVEGVRSNWTPKPVSVKQYDIPFLARLGLEDGVLANAFMITDIPYSWKKGKTETWKG